MRPFNPHACDFCGADHRPGVPGSVPMCKIGRSAPSNQVVVPRPVAEPGPPQRAPVDFEPEGDVVPPWAEEIVGRRRRDLDEPAIVKRDRLGTRLAMREYRMRKKLRLRGADDEEIAEHIERARAAWRAGERYKV